MIICICQNISEKKIISIINEKHISSIKSLQKEITICDQCKICAYDLKKIIFIENKRKNPSFGCGMITTYD